MSKFDISIKTDGSEYINLSDFDENLWLALWKVGSHCSTNLTRDQVVELRDALNQFLSQEQTNGL